MLTPSCLPQGIRIHLVNSELVAMFGGDFHQLFGADLLLHRLLKIGVLEDCLEKAFQRCTRWQGWHGVTNNILSINNPVGTLRLPLLMQGLGCEVLLAMMI